MTAEAGRPLRERWALGAVTALLGAGLVLAGFVAAVPAGTGSTAVTTKRGGETPMEDGAAETRIAASAGGEEGRQEDVARATFAGGCFWCMEPPFDDLEGVVSTTSGYAGGHVQDPSYERVSAGGTGHREAMQVVYRPGEVSYAELLRVFWRNVDPTDDGGQFCDRGFQYTTAIFYHDEEQKRLAESSKRELEASGKIEEPIVTDIAPLNAFYPAEEYHQDYYRKHPIRYKFYRLNCGRDRTLKRIWGDEAGGGH